MYKNCIICGYLISTYQTFCTSCTNNQAYPNSYGYKNYTRGTITNIKNSKKEPMKISLLKKLLSPEDRMLSKYVFTECGDLNMNSELVQEALLKTKGFREALLLIVKAHDKKKKSKKCDEE